MADSNQVVAAPRTIGFEIITLFPEFFDAFLRVGLLGKAVASGLVHVARTNPRDFAQDKHRSVDDTPYGGGPGMILRPQPVADAVEHVVAARGPAHRILLSPQGRLFDQARARALVEKERILFICGRYEGLDERISDLCADEILSIGDYVLGGGEVAAAVIIEAVSRLLPGVVGCEDSVAAESHQEFRLEYPQWTRPPSFLGLSVPPVLLSGDHAAIADWRTLEALRRTRERRPDLLVQKPPTDRERALEARADQEAATSKDPSQLDGDPVDP